MRTITGMGLLDVFKRTRSSILMGSGQRTFTLVVAGHGIETRPRLPATTAHLADGTLVFGPVDLAAAKAQGVVPSVLVRPGAAPTAMLERRAMSDHGIVTYSSAQRGTTQLILGTGMRDHDELLEAVGIANQPAGWRLVTDQIDVAWPAGFSLRASGDTTAEHGPMHLAHEGSAHDVIYLYGPLIGDAIPAPEQLQTGGGTRIDAAAFDGAVKSVRHYTFEGDAFAQRYYYVPLDSSAIYLVRACATIDKASMVFAAADLMCRSLKPRW